MEKRVLADVDTIYAVCPVHCDGELYYVAASEKKNGPTVLINPKTKNCETIWTEPGGITGLCEVEDRGFLSIDEFYPVFISKDAAVYHIRIEGPDGKHTFVKKKLFDLPWAHRVAYCYEEDGNYVITASLCKHKEFVEDWSTKGSVYAVKYANGEMLGELENILPETILKNHAMCIKKKVHGYDDIYVGGAEGVYKLSRENGSWISKHICSVPTSDLTLYDLDGDGKDELCIIEGFHGTVMEIFHQEGDEYVPVYSQNFEFGHVLISGQIEGKPTLVLGTRAAEKFINLIRFEEEHYKEILVDSGVTASQAMILANPVTGKDHLVVAQHGISKITEYIF